MNKFNILFSSVCAFSILFGDQVLGSEDSSSDDDDGRGHVVATEILGEDVFCTLEVCLGTLLDFLLPNEQESVLIDDINALIATLNDSSSGTSRRCQDYIVRIVAEAQGATLPPEVVFGPQDDDESRRRAEGALDSFEDKYKHTLTDNTQYAMDNFIKIFRELIDARHNSDRRINDLLVREYAPIKRRVLEFSIKQRREIDANLRREAVALRERQIGCLNLQRLEIEARLHELRRQAAAAAPAPAPAAAAAAAPAPAPAAAAAAPAAAARENERFQRATEANAAREAAAAAAAREAAASEAAAAAAAASANDVLRAAAVAREERRAAAAREANRR